MFQHHLRFPVALAAVSFLALSAQAGPPSTGKEIKQVVEEKKSLCDTIFGLPVLYSDKENPFIQKIALTGRLHADAAFYEGGATDVEKLAWRRARAGIKVNLLEQFTFHTEVDFDLQDSDPLYQRLTNVKLSWSPSDAVKLNIGKFDAAFTMDGATSSNQLLRPERSLLSDNLWFTNEYFVGVGAEGKIGRWVYNVGVFSADGDPEFGSFDSGWFGLVSAGYDFGQSLGIDKALVRLDYVGTDLDEGGDIGTRLLSHVVSLNADFEIGRWGLRTDVAAADGFGSQSDLFAVAIMPYFDITEYLQLVASYNYVHSADPNGVRLSRYEAQSAGGRVDEAHEFFFGVNYYLCGHKLKWQNGVQYTTTEDSADDGGSYEGWGFTSAFRLSW